MITQARLAPYEVPFVRPYVTASVRHETRRGVLVELTDEEGNRGLGEAAPLSSRTEGQRACEQALEDVLDRVGQESPEAEELLGRVEEGLPELASAPAARAGLVTALTDLLARRGGRSLADELARRWMPEPAEVSESVPVNATVPVMDQQDTVAAATGHVQAGFGCLKLKVGTDWETDRERVRAVREAVGPEVALRLDVNQAWAPDLAIRRLADLCEVGLEYVEQPTPGDDLEGMVRVRAGSDVPVAADEPVTSVEAARALIDLEAADVLVLKPMVLGGPDRALAIANLAREAGLRSVVTSTIDGAVGRALALHTACALGPSELACGLATAGLLAEDVVPHDEQIVQGRMHRPPGPGHGLAMAEEGSP